MAETKSKGVSSHLADTFYKIEQLKEKHPESIDELAALEKSIHAIAREVYRLKKLTFSSSHR